MAGATAMMIGGGAMGLLGNKSQKSSQKKAAAANQEQQERALAFQREMQIKQMEHLSGAFKGMYERIYGQSKARREDMQVELQSGGWSPGSSLSLSAQRAGYRDETRAVQEAGSMEALAKANVYRDASFPLIQTDAMPSGMTQLGGAMLGAGMYKA